MSSERPVRVRRRGANAQQYLQDEGPPAAPVAPLLPAVPLAPAAHLAPGHKQPPKRRTSLASYSAAATPETLSMASVHSGLRAARPPAAAAAAASSTSADSADNSSGRASPSPTLHSLRTPKKSHRRRDSVLLAPSSTLSTMTVESATKDPPRRRAKSPGNSDAQSEISLTGSQRSQGLASGSSVTRHAASATSDPRVTARGKSPRLPKIKESPESQGTNSIVKVAESDAQHKQEEVHVRGELLESRLKRPRRVPSAASAASKRSARRWSDAQESAHFFSAAQLHALSDATRAAIATALGAGARPLEPAPASEYGSDTFVPIRIKEPRSNEGIKKQRPVKKTPNSPSEEAKQRTSAGGARNLSSQMTGLQRPNTTTQALTNNDSEAALGFARKQRTTYDSSDNNLREEEPTGSEEPASVKHRVVRKVWSSTHLPPPPAPHAAHAHAQRRARSLTRKPCRSRRAQDESSTSSLLFVEALPSKMPEVARSIASLVTGAKDTGSPSSRKTRKNRSKTRLKLSSSLHTLSLSVSTCSLSSPADDLTLKTDSASSRDTEKSTCAGQKTPKSVRLNDRPIDEEPPPPVREVLLPKDVRPRSLTPTGELERASQNMHFRRELHQARSPPPNAYRSVSTQDVHRAFPTYTECPLCKLTNQCYHLPRVNPLFPMFPGRRSMAAGTGTRVELYAHLEGSVRYETVWELMKSKNLKLPGDGSLRAMRDALISKIPVESVHYLEHIPIYLQAIAGDMQALQRLAYEFCEDKVKQGLLYVEARYIPHLLMKNKKLRHGKLLHDLSKVVMAVNRGFRIAEAQLGITVRSILCIVIGMNIARDIIRLCERFQNDGVVGIDLMLPCVLEKNKGSFVLYEEVPLTGEELRAFETATMIGIKRTVHAGQAGAANMVERAINKYCAQRLGHGYEVLKKPGLYAQCREQDVHFECCPWDSLLSGAVDSAVEKHPIARFAEDGVNFGLNNSHPTLTGVTLQEVYDLATSWGLTEAHIVRANINALRSSFLPGEQKQQLMQTLLENLGIKRRRSKE